MKTKIRFVLFFLLILLITAMSYVTFSETPQYGEFTEHYVAPKEKEVLEKLDDWQDMKFGMLIHYGLYSQLATVESWELTDEDWIHRNPPMAVEEYRKIYWGAANDFAPTKLDPESWAKTGKDAGMKYVVFTTKHHDGFNMFDTKYSDFSITKHAFKDHPRNNVAKEVFNAFRKEGYMIGAYFSKPDWKSEFFWNPEKKAVDRFANYYLKEDPERWEKFKEFSYNQIEELVSGEYGQIDMLWFDGYWVRPTYMATYDFPGDSHQRTSSLDMDKIANMARGYNPSMIFVDRGVYGPQENYTTVEYGIPKTQLANPWETCLPLIDGSWTFSNHPTYKTNYRVISEFVEILAKGGNFLLGVGPAPDGTLPQGTTDRLREIGEWVSKNKEAVYGTRTVENYNDSTTNTWFVRSKDEKKIFAIKCLEEGQPIPTKISWEGNEPSEGDKIFFVETGEEVEWNKTDKGVEVIVPKGLAKNQPALAFSFTPNWDFKIANFNHKIKRKKEYILYNVFN